MIKDRPCKSANGSSWWLNLRKVQHCDRQLSFFRWQARSDSDSFDLWPPVAYTVWCFREGHYGSDKQELITMRSVSVEQWAGYVGCMCHWWQVNQRLLYTCSMIQMFQMLLQCQKYYFREGRSRDLNGPVEISFEMKLLWHCKTVKVYLGTKFPSAFSELTLWIYHKSLSGTHTGTQIHMLLFCTRHNRPRDRTWENQSWASHHIWPLLPVQILN